MAHHKVPINLGSVEQKQLRFTGEILLHVPLQIITTTTKTTIIKEQLKNLVVSLQPKLCKSRDVIHQLMNYVSTLLLLLFFTIDLARAIQK